MAMLHQTFDLFQEKQSKRTIDIVLSRVRRRLQAVRRKSGDLQNKMHLLYSEDNSRI